jgi:hypothetical protein
MTYYDIQADLLSGVTKIKTISDEDLIILKTGFFTAEYVGLYISSNEWFSPKFRTHVMASDEIRRREKEAAMKKIIKIRAATRKRVIESKNFFGEVQDLKELKDIVKSVTKGKSVDDIMKGK